MLTFHRLPVACSDHLPDLSKQRSYSNLSWPICWWNRDIGASFALKSSAPDRCQRPHASLGRDFLFYLDLARVDFAPSGQANHRLFPFFHPQGPLGFE